MSVNKSFILGNMCFDPKVTEFESGAKVAQIRVATNKPAFKKADGTEVPERVEYHDIVLLGQNAVYAESYAKKGDKVYIEGELRTRKYEHKGILCYITEIYAYVFELLTPKAKQGSASAPAPNEERPW